MTTHKVNGKMITIENMEILKESDIRKTSNHFMYVGHEDVCVRINIEDKSYPFVIRPGFRWSASAPWFLWWCIGKPTDERFKIATLFHDLGYLMKWKKSDMDTIFLCLQKNGNVSIITYWGVRILGQSRYISRNKWYTSLVDFIFGE